MIKKMKSLILQIFICKHKNITVDGCDFTGSTVTCINCNKILSTNY